MGKKLFLDESLIKMKTSPTKKHRNLKLISDDFAEYVKSQGDAFLDHELKELDLMIKGELRACCKGYVRKQIMLAKEIKKQKPYLLNNYPDLKDLNKLKLDKFRATF